MFTVQISLKMEMGNLNQRVNSFILNYCKEVFQNISHYFFLALKKVKERKIP